MSPGRRIEVEGTTNFRDIGGYTMKGGTVRYGMLFRSDGLQSLTANGLHAYANLGITMAYDLRRELESQQLPNPVPTTPLCMLSEVERARGPRPDRGRVETAEQGETMMRDGYLAMVEHGMPVIARIIGEVAGGTRPAVFHCHGGKDRTGVTAAVILDLLGVARETVLDDYELTSKYRFHDDQVQSFNNLIGSGVSEVAAMAMLGTPRWAMSDAMQLLDSLGGSRGYLVSAGRANPGVLDSFVELMRA